MTQPTRSPIDLRERVEVETPEQVTLRYEVAGLGSRGLAAAVDHLLLFGVLFAIDGLGDLLVHFDIDWFTAAFSIAGFVMFWGYFTLFEAWQGQTPGKRLVRLRVVRTDGHAVGFTAAAMRNLIRVIDFLPPPYLTGLTLLFLHPRSRRVGDLVADTLVVREGIEPLPARPAPAERTRRLSEGLRAARLGPEEFQLLEGFVERSGQLDADARTRLAKGLAQRLAAHAEGPMIDAAAFLQELYAEERERRESGQGGTGGEVAALRLAARQTERWREFERLATRASANGLDTFDAEELPDYAARYREVTADLARLRTYQAPAAMVHRLERLAAAGHNTLYPPAEAGWRRTLPILGRECPAAVIQAGGSVLLALAILVAGGSAGYLTLRERPALAQEVISPVMLDRAASAASRTSQGLTYVEVEADEHDDLAAALMQNNIAVAIYCFAGGVLLGVGSLFLLAMNAISIGTSFGHFVNVGAGKYLLSFVLAHGILELFAICVAAAAGMRLGLALWLPGPLSRGDAIARTGPLALRMLGAATTLLVVAGLIEGLASASGASFAYRVAVSSASAVFLLLYLANGARWAGTLDAP